MRHAALHGQYCTSGKKMQSGRCGGKSSHRMCLNLQSSMQLASIANTRSKVTSWQSHLGLGCCMRPGQIRGIMKVIGRPEKMRGRGKGRSSS